MKITISNKIKNKYPSIPLKEIEQFQLEYKKRQYYSIESKIDGKDFARNVLMFLFCTLQRSYSLYKGAINSLNNRDVIVSYLAARAHMESTGSIAYCLIQLEKYYKGEISFDQIDSYLYKLHLGRKYYSEDTDYPEIIDTIGVMTLIDSVDKVYFKSMDKKHKKMFRNTYEWLSEFCHPNHFGQIIGVIQEGKKAVFNYNHFPDKDEVQHFFFSLISSCHLLFPMYDNCFALINEHETMPEICTS